MFFTQEDYRKIEKWLLANSRKDTDFVGASTPLQGNETLAFVQKGKNVKVSLKDLIEQIFLLGVSDFLNVTDKYGESRISLTQAIQLIPYKSRKIGQVITFLDEDGEWKLFQFQGERVNQWNNATLWVDLIERIQGISIIDSEDITATVDNLNQTSLTFADKNYNTTDYSGLGRVYLRKNIQRVQNPNTGIFYNTNLLTQQMISKENTIYIIQYDYNLNGQTITVPSGCVLLFEGGSFTNGNLNGNNTEILGNPTHSIFNDCVIKGFNFKSIDIRWFGAIPDFNQDTKGGTDNALFIKRAIEASEYNAGISLYLSGKYLIETPIEVKHDLNIKGNYSNNVSYTEDANVKYENTTSMIYVKGNISAFYITGRGNGALNANINISNLYLEGDDTSTFIEYVASGAPTRIGNFSQVEVKGFDKVLYFHHLNEELDTIFGGLIINQVVAYEGNQFIVAKASGNLATLCNLHIKDSNIEHYKNFAVELENLFGTNIIDNNIIEGQLKSIKASIKTGSLQITNNYFENSFAESICEVSGGSNLNSFVTYENNWKPSNSNRPVIKFRNVTLTHYNNFNHSPENISVDLCIINEDNLHRFSTESFSNYVNTTSLRYYSDHDLGDNVLPLFFGQEKFNNNLYGKTLGADNTIFYLGNTVSKYSVQVGDVFVVCLYAEEGNLRYGIYGGPTHIGTVNSVSTSVEGMRFLKLVVSKAHTGYVSIRLAAALQDNIKVGNGFVFKNPSNILLSSMGIYPPNTIPKVPLDTYNPTTLGALDIFSKGNAKYYSDGNFIRNINGTLSNKEVIVSEYIHANTFTKPVVYRLVGDINLGQNAVEVAQGASIIIEPNVKISNGNLTLNDNVIYPMGINLTEIMEANLYGNFGKGQLIYDPDLGEIKMWDGTNWINSDGTLTDKVVII